MYTEMIRVLLDMSSRVWDTDFSIGCPLPPWLDNVDDRHPLWDDVVYTQQYPAGRRVMPVLEEDYDC